MPKRTSKWNGLQRNKRPKRISDKKRAKLSEELAVKRIVYRRAGGHPFDSAGQNGVVTNVLCEGGNCEICKEKPTPPTYKLSPHEILFRSAGGVPSEDITFATDDLCHWIFQHHLLTDKEQCIKLITKFRQVSQERAEQIFGRMMEFYEAHKDNMSTKAVSKLR